MAAFGVLFVYIRDFIRGVNPFTPGKIKAKHEAQQKEEQNSTNEE